MRGRPPRRSPGRSASCSRSRRRSSSSSTTSSGVSRPSSTSSRAWRCFPRRSPILLVCMARPELAHASRRLARHSPPRAAARGGGRRADLRAAVRAAGANRPRRRRQPALPHRDARDGRRDGGRRRPADAARVTRGPPRPARATRARRARARGRRGRAVPPRRRPGARARGDPDHAEAGGADPEGPDPSRPGTAGRRRRVPVQASPDPRRRLRGTPEVDPRRAPPALRGVARAARRRTWSSSTRSSATTSSRLTGMRPSSVWPTRAQSSPRRAAAHLRAAGERAAGRGDAAAAVKLLGRASSLIPNDDPARREVQVELASALVDRGELNEAQSILAAVVDEAHAAGEEVVEWRARRWPHRRPAVAERGGIGVARRARRGRRFPSSSGTRDDLGLARAWFLVGLSTSGRASRASRRGVRPGPRLRAACAQRARRGTDPELVPDQRLVRAHPGRGGARALPRCPRADLVEAGRGDRPHRAGRAALALGPLRRGARELEGRRGDPRGARSSDRRGRDVAGALRHRAASRETCLPRRPCCARRARSSRSSASRASSRPARHVSDSASRSRTVPARPSRSSSWPCVR